MDSPFPGMGVQRASRLPELGEESRALAQQLSRHGAAAVVCIDTAWLWNAERRHGAAACHQIQGRLVDRLERQLAGHLEAADRVVQGELGESELLVLFFRSRGDGGFFGDELPRLLRDLERHLAPPANRLGYPYLRDPLRLHIGASVVFHDPALRGERTLRRACRLAREDAELRSRCAARERRDALLALFYQEGLRMALEPIVGLEDRRARGWEALVRGPAGSELATPRMLFAVAQEADLTFELDCRCRAAALARAKDLPPGNKLFLNCLPSAIHDPAFQGDALRRTLQAHGLEPSDVVFEISEAESIANWEIFREVCDHYAGLGFGIALDDVGAGYGSLEAVAELRPDFVKVDLAFVRGIDADPARQEVLTALLGVARRIGATLIAEGIETPEQLATLKHLGVPLGQGFLFREESRSGLEGGGSGRESNPPEPRRHGSHRI